MKTKEEWELWVTKPSLNIKEDIASILYELEQRAENADEEWNIAQTEMDNMVRANQRTVIRMRALEKVAEAARAMAMHGSPGWSVVMDALDELDALEKNK